MRRNGTASSTVRGVRHGQHGRPGVLTLYVYNGAGQQTTQIADDNTARPETTQDGYDGAGNETTATDPDGNQT